MPPITADWINIAALVGALQGFFLAGVLATHRSNRTANRLLAILIVAFTIGLVSSVYYAAGLERVYPHFFGVSYPLPWVYGPLLYLYALTASDRRRRLGPRDALHLVPIVLVLLAGVPIYLMSGADKLALYDRLRSGDAPAVIKILDPSKYLSGLSYTVATVVFLARHRTRVKDSYSSVERVNLKWLLRLVGAAAAIWVVATASDIAGIARSSDDIVTLAIALLVYAIGYMGLRQPEIFLSASLDQTATETPVPVVAAPSEPAPPTTPRYVRSNLTDRETAELKDALVAAMAKDRMYRNPDLTLAALAEHIETTPHKLSEVLNGELAVTFYDFVNRYRVEEVRQNIADGKSKHRNLLTLAMDAGFASKSTFNQVFKNQTGQTPSTYRKTIGD